MFLEHLQSKETKHREMAVRAFGKSCEATNDTNVKIEVVDQICKLLEGTIFTLFPFLLFSPCFVSREFLGVKVFFFANLASF